MHSATSDRIRGVLVAAFVAATGGLSLAGIYLARQTLGGRSLDVALLAALLPFAIWSFGLRTLRWHTLARLIIPDVSPRLSSLVQLVGFAFAVTPGRVAEVYKLKLLERATGVPIARVLPAMIVERLTEVIALGVLIVAGEVLRWSSTAETGSTSLLLAVGSAVLIVALILARLFVGARAARERADAPSSLPRRIPSFPLSLWERARVRVVPPPRSHTVTPALVTAGYDPHPDPLPEGEGIEAWLRPIPVLRRLVPLLSSDRVAGLVRQARIGGTSVTRPGTLALALAFVILGRLGDGVVLWKISQAVGFPMPYPLALVLVGTSALVGGISLSPGGIGTAEAALVGLVVAHGMPLGAAVVAALTTRILLFWLWVVLGLCVLAVYHGYAFAKESAAHRRIGAWRPVALAKTTVEREG